MIKGLVPTVKRNVWALIVIPIVITIIPYGLTWCFWPTLGTRNTITDIRFILAGFVLFSGIMCKVKIGLYEIGFLRNRKNEIKFDKFLTILVYGSLLISFVSYLPVLIVLLCVAHFASKNEVKGGERIAIVSLLVTMIAATIFFGFMLTPKGAFPLGLFVVLSFCSIFVLLIWLAFFSKDKRVGHGKRIIDGALYILSEATGFIFGLSLEVRGKILDWILFLISNHEGAFEYIGGIWTSILKWRTSKILAGNNLNDFWIIGQLIGLKVISVIRKATEKKGFAGKVIRTFRKFKMAVKRIYYTVFLSFILRKKISVPVKIENSFTTLREVRRCREKKILVWTPPPGRERLKDEGALKRIDPRNLKDIDVLQAVLCIGPIWYKPAGKGDPEGAKQWWVSPRKIYVWILNPIHRLPEETDEEFSDRLWQIMSAYKAKFILRIDLKERLAKERLDRFFERVTRPFRIFYSWLLSLFDESYLGT